MREVRIYMDERPVTNVVAPIRATKPLDSYESINSVQKTVKIHGGTFCISCSVRTHTRLSTIQALPFSGKGYYKAQIDS
jgi:hypothetical protein